MIELRKAQHASALSVLAAQHNALREAMVGSNVHFTKTAGPPDESTDPPSESALTVAVADASSLATLLVLANDLKRVVNLHFADTYAHDSAVSGAVATAAATDLATAEALLNAIKAAYNTHRSEASVHPNDDAGNAVSAADATDQASSETLGNEIKTDLNAHMALSLAGSHVRLVQS